MRTDTIERLPAWAPVALRFALGVIMFAHGAQKLFGWFEGRGFSTTVGFVETLGFKPALLWALLLIGAEFGGGLLLLVGFLTRFAAAAIFIDMLVAMFLVHWKNGFFLSGAGGSGIEYTLALAAMALALFMAGAGPLSIDRKIGWKLG